MKKIMFFRPMYYMGGTEIAILSLIRKLDDYDIYIGYTDDTSSEELLDRYKKYAKVVKIDENFNEEIDTLVLCSPYKTVLDILEKVNSKKNILWFHHFGNREASVFLDERLYTAVHEIIAVSETCKKVLLKQEYGSKLKNRVKVIYNIIDSEDIIKKSQIETEIDTDHELNIVSVGRICYEKGAGRTLELARMLKKHNIDFKWYLIGGNYYESVEKEIRSKYEELKEHFVFMGFMDNPYNVMKKCDYLALLSDDETWGLVLTEAKILGVPCIVTDFEVAYEQILDNRTGVILSREDIASYEDKIDAILNNKQYYKNNLRKFKFSNEKTTKKWKKLL